jgi:hypothetical protein
VATSHVLDRRAKSVPEPDGLGQASGSLGIGRQPCSLSGLEIPPVATDS